MCNRDIDVQSGRLLLRAEGQKKCVGKLMLITKPVVIKVVASNLVGRKTCEFNDVQ